jgi:hypothetical protein
MPGTQSDFVPFVSLRTRDRASVRVALACGARLSSLSACDVQVSRGISAAVCSQAAAAALLPAPTGHDPFGELRWFLDGAVPLRCNLRVFCLSGTPLSISARRRRTIRQLPIRHPC